MMGDSSQVFRISEAQAGHPPILGSFGRLQRLNLVQIQLELADLKANLHANSGPNETQVKDLRRLLHEYADAIRDLEYVEGLAPVEQKVGRDHMVDLLEAFPHIATRKGAPFNTTYRIFHKSSLQEPDAVREALRVVLPRRLAWTQAEKEDQPGNFWHMEAPEIYSAWVDRIARFVMAFLVGAALLVPMIIMVLRPTLTKSLITISVAVLLFAFFLAFGISATNEQTIIATATYTAVLVVLVGTSTSGGIS